MLASRRPAPMRPPWGTGTTAKWVKMDRGQAGRGPAELATAQPAGQADAEVGASHRQACTAARKEGLGLGRIRV